MARTKQKVREEWQEKKRAHSAATTAGQSTDGAGPSGASSATAATEAAARLRAQDEADEAAAYKEEEAEPSAEHGKEEAEADEDDGEEEEEYKVVCIVAERVYRKAMQYKVKWEGFADHTWEPAANLKNTAALEEWLAKEKARKAGEEEDDGDDDEEAEEDEAEAGGNDDESDSDSSFTRGRKQRKRKAGGSDSSYKGSSDDEEEEDSDSDAEYVPEGGRGRSKRARGAAAAPKPLNSRQLGALEEDLAKVSSLAALRVAVTKIVKAHPQVFATARAELQSCEPKRKLPGRRGRAAVVDESEEEEEDDEDEDEDEDDEKA